MRIALSSKSNNLESEIDPRFGRCNYFIIIDIETMSFESISNESSIASGGAGIKAAQTLSKVEVDVVVTGNMGPNAFQTLSAAGIKVFIGANGTIKEAIEQFKNGKLNKLESPSVGSHFGMKTVGRGFGRG